MEVAVKRAIFSLLATANLEGNKMTPETLTSIRELASRVNDGLQVRLLWGEHDGRLWVTVMDIRTGDLFCLSVREGERPLEVFNHPYAYAAHHGVETQNPAAALDVEPALVA